MPEGTLSYQAHLGKPYRLANDTSAIYLFVSAKASESLAEQPLTPLNVSLVLDRSGSMSGAKLQHAKEAAKFIIDQLGKEDRISVVAYDHEILVVRESQVASSKHKKRLKKSIDAITHNGSTNLSGGMLEGFNQVRNTYIDGYVNRVLLMSDGLANKGITDRFKLQDTVQQINRKENITLSTFGLGADFDEDLMEALADYGGANYYFIEKERNIRKVFSKELQFLQSVIAQNGQLLVDFPADKLHLEEVFGYPFTLEQGKLIINFSDVFAGEEKGALIKFTLREPLAAPLAINTLFTYSNVNSKLKDAKEEQTLTLTPTKDTAKIAAHSAEIVDRNVALFLANQSLSQAIKEVDNGNFGIAREMTRLNQDYLANFEDQFEQDSILLRQYATNLEYLKQIDKVEAINDYRMKMMQKFAKSENYKIRKRREE